MIIRLRWTIVYISVGQNGQWYYTIITWAQVGMTTSYGQIEWTDKHELCVSSPWNGLDKSQEEVVSLFFSTFVLYLIRTWRQHISVVSRPHLFVSGHFEVSEIDRRERMKRRKKPDRKREREKPREREKDIRLSNARFTFGIAGDCGPHSRQIQIERRRRGSYAPNTAVAITDTPWYS